MNHTEFFKALKSGEISPVYFFAGEEQYVMRSALKQLENAVISEDLKDVNLTVLPAAATGSEICSSCETFPFLSDKRMVILEESVFLSTTGKADGEDQFLEYLKNPLDTTVLVIINSSPDKRKKLYKALQNHTVVEFNPLSDSELSRWIEKILKGFDLTIESSALQFLMEYADARPEALITELEKLASYKMEGTITKEDILQVVTPCNDYNIFKMIDAILNKDAKTSLMLLSGMLLNKEEPIYILGAISKQYRQLLRIKTLLEEKTPRQEIISLMSMRDFIYKRLENVCNKTTSKKLKLAMDLCYATDEGLKTRLKFDEAALHTLVYQLASL